MKNFWEKIKEWFKNNYKKLIMCFCFVILAIMQLCFVGLTIQLFIDAGIIWKVIISSVLQIGAITGIIIIWNKLLK